MDDYPNASDHEFLFDDFFVSTDKTDPGQEIDVTINGRTVPLFVKRGLSLSDREAAKSQAVKTRITPTGQPEIVSFNETIFAVELMFRCIKSWPFKHKDGTSVAITRENIQAMLATGADAIATKIVNLLQTTTETKAPFLTTSEKS